MNSTTPPGTPPQPKRRSTKHKKPAYGDWLRARAELRRIRRPARPARGWNTDGKGGHVMRSKP